MLEKELLDRFIASGKLPGVFLREVGLGEEVQGGGVMRIDAVCVSEGWVRDEVGSAHRLEDAKAGGVAELGRVTDRWLALHLEKGKVWLIEAKRALNAEVLGQILTDKYKFAESFKYRQDYRYTSGKVFRNLTLEGVGVVCEKKNEFLFDVFKANGVRVWFYEH